MYIYIPGWIPEKGRRDGVKGLPFARRSPAATASTGTLIFDLGRSPFSVHVYSIPTECFFLPWTSLVAARIASDRTDIMDSSPSTPYFSLPSPPPRLTISRRGGERTGVDPILNIKVCIRRKREEERDTILGEIVGKFDHLQLECTINW